MQVSSYNVGCLSGCLINFAIGNRLGRRQALWIAMFTLSVGAVIQTASYGVRGYMKWPVARQLF